MKLNQIIAVEKTIKSKVVADVDLLYKAVQKPVLFEGFIKTYKKKDDAGEDYPPERQRVQGVVSQVIAEVTERTKELFDVTAQKDWANCTAKADVIVDGEKILEGAPTTFLLFLEKQLTDLRTMVEKLPVLDPSEDWELDASNGLFKTKPTETIRTKKVQKALVLYPAVDKHPAQTQLITEDEAVGTWEKVRFSGAMKDLARRALVQRLERLQVAVKQAREQANLTEAPKIEVGEKILKWIFNPS